MKSLLFLMAFFVVACSHSKGRQSGILNAEYKMGDKMDETEFWKIVDYAFAACNGNMKMEGQVITQKLSQYSADQIVEFEMILCKKLILANDFKILAADQIIDGTLTDDTYLYFRCWLIGLGKKTFEQTMGNPDSLAGVIEKGVEPDFEDLLYVATMAYENKTGKKQENDSFPMDVAFSKGLNYDFGGPKTTGKEWKESELPILYPKLWNKFK